MPGWLPAKTRRALKTLDQLPKRQSLNYLRYRLALDSGWLKAKTRAPSWLRPAALQPALPLFPLPARARLARTLTQPELDALQAEAAEITSGRVRLFGGPPVRLQLASPQAEHHWTDLERGRSLAEADYPEDLKLVWEPARFGWAVTLARAACLLDDERYQQTFWQLTRDFLAANPPYYGWNWTSAQEVAVRLISLVFALHVFQRAPGAIEPDLLSALAAHAERIPVSLAYARAQDNNHLLSEAAGMYTAGCLLPGHPRAGGWRRQGWDIFHQALQQQIDPDGVYIQHSANYTRLMLQLALWVRLVGMGQRQTFPALSQERLAQATRWLLDLVEHTNGRVPNLGPNDGAYLLPLSSQPFDDYRPVLQAAGRAFLNQPPFPSGPWDEMSHWLAGQPDETAPARPVHSLSTHTLRHPEGNTWAYLRTARFRSRPGHADQLHVDLWWRGHNLARDPGTYRYAAAPPWDNALVHTPVHNTVSLDGLDQMTPAGRFLFLDWAQAQVLAYRPPGPLSEGCITARHDGYHPLGWDHQRTLQPVPGNGWRITDRLDPLAGAAAQPAAVRLHWLLPDWPWQVQEVDGEAALHLQSPDGEVRLLVTAIPVAQNTEVSTAPPLQVGLFRAGECLYGQLPAQPTWGWFSPTYNQRQPALSLACTLQGTPPLAFESTFVLPDLAQG